MRADEALNLWTVKILQNAIDLVPQPPTHGRQLSADRQTKRDATIFQKADPVECAGRHVVEGQGKVQRPKILAQANVFKTDDATTLLQIGELLEEDVSGDRVQPVQRIARVSRPNAMVVEDDYDWRFVHCIPLPAAGPT